MFDTRAFYTQKSPKYELLIILSKFTRDQVALSISMVAGRSEPPPGQTPSATLLPGTDPRKRFSMFFCAIREEIADGLYSDPHRSGRNPGRPGRGVPSGPQVIVPLGVPIRPVIRYSRRVPSSNLPIGTARIFRPRENECSPA